MPSTDKDKGELGLSYTADVNAKWYYCHFGKQFGRFFNKVKDILANYSTSTLPNTTWQEQQAAATFNHPDEFQRHYTK